MIHQICPSCNLPKVLLGSRTSAMMNVCPCEPYSPVMDRGHPDTAATENQRLIDLVASQGREVASLATGHDLYEVVRRMHVQQFIEVYVLNRNTGKPFDEIVAGMAHEFGLTVRK